MTSQRFSPPVLRAVTVLTSLKLVLNAGFRFVYPFLPALGRGLGVDLSRMGLLLSVRWGIGFTVPFAVRGVHRPGHSRRLLVAGLIAFAAGSLVTVITGVFIGALIGFALVGVGKPMFDIGAQTYVSERVAYARRARAFGILELSWAGGFLIGAPVAGWLIERSGWKLPFWTFGTVALLSLAAVVLLLDQGDAAARIETGSTDQPRAAIIPFLLVVAVSGFTHEMVLVVMGAWLENEFAMTLIALAGVGFLLGAAELVGEGAMVAFTDRIGKRNSFALGLAAGGGALAVLAFTHDVAGWALVSLFGVILALEFAVISALPLASEYRPNDRSRFLAWFLVVAGSGRIVADLVGPFVFERWGMGAVALTAATSAVLGSLLLVRRVVEVETAIATLEPPR